VRHAVLAACLVAGLVPAAAHARDVTKTAHSGDVTATLTYRVVRDNYSRVHVRIDRGGATGLDAALTEVASCKTCATWAPGPFSVPGPPVVRDLDADGEPEVVLDLYTGGAHCCAVTAFYRWDGARYRRTAADFGNFGYRLKDLDGDGRPELSARDEAFAYAFGPFVYSVPPVTIFEYQAGALRDVTRNYPDAIRADAKETFGYYVKARKKRDHAAIRGVLAGWAADECLLDRCAYAFARVNASLRAGELSRQSTDPSTEPANDAYIAKLRAFLRKYGYLR
jgi:hypothetical protein